MKLPALALLFLGIIALHATAAIAPVSRVNISVEQHSSSKLPKATPGHPPVSNIAQHRSLTIRLTNITGEPIDGVVVKYFFIGHDMKDHKMKVLQHGERKATLAPRKTEAVESEEAVNTYTEAHSEAAKSKGGSKGKSKGGTRTTKIPASGQKVTGYAVQVFVGSKLETEEYTTPSYKQVVGESTPSISEKSIDPSKVPAKKSPKKK